MKPKRVRLRRGGRWPRLAALVPVGALLALFLVPGSASASNIAPGYIHGYVGMCLDLRGDLANQEQPVQIYGCNGTHAQIWRASTVIGDDEFYIELASAPSMCLDIYQEGVANRSKVELYMCGGFPNPGQLWVPRPGGALYNPQSGKCLDDPASSTTPGTQLQIWDCNGGANQNWQWPPSF